MKKSTFFGKQFSIGLKGYILYTDPHVCICFSYFDDDAEEEDLTEAGGGGNLEYQPAPDSPTHDVPSDSDSDDPLDAFMVGIEVSSIALTLKPTLTTLYSAGYHTVV